MAKSSGTKVPDALIRLGYANGEEIIRAMAEEHGLNYVDLSEAVIPPSWSNSFPSRSPGKMQ